MTDNDKMREAFINACKEYGPTISFSDFEMGWDACMEQAAKSVPVAVDVMGSCQSVPAVGHGTPYYDPSTAEVPPPGHPLQKLGEYLSSLLDEDEWATAEQHLLAAWAEQPVPVVGEVVAYRHTLRMELGQTYSEYSESADPTAVHGVRGSNYDESYYVTVEPLFTYYVQPTHSITTAELERLRKDAERWRVVKQNGYVTEEAIDAAIGERK